MKNKTNLLKLIPSALLISCFVIPFLQIFSSQYTIGNTVSQTGTYGLFADYTSLIDAFELRGSTLSTFWMVLTSILIVVLAVLALAYIVTFVLELLNVKVKNLTKVSKILSICLLVISILAIVSALIATLTNNHANSLSTLSLIFNLGTWLLIIPVVASLIACIIPEAKKTKKK